MTSRFNSGGWRQLRSVRSAWKSLKYITLLVLTALIAVVLSGYLNGAIAQLPIAPMPDPPMPDDPVPVEVVPKPRPVFPEMRGVWMTSNDIDVMRDHAQLEAAVTELAQLNFNTIYSVVWNSGYVMYPSPVAQQAGIQPFVWRGLQGQDMLQDLINLAHRQGLLVMPWFEFGFMAPQLSELTTNHPDWLTQKRDGSQTTTSAAGEVVWLNPFHPEVQKLMTDLVLEAITRYDADGIQFDDHTSLPVEFGYDPYTVNLYRQETQQDPPANPQDPGWMRWRADKLTAFMTQLKEAVKARRPNAIFSVSPNPYNVAYNAFLQDWITWVRQGIADELVVQIYRPDLQSFVEQLDRPEIQEAQYYVPTGAGVLTGLRNRPVPMSLIQSKVRAARDRGLGFAFFFYESLWDEAPEPPAVRQSSFQALFPNPVSRTNHVTSRAEF